METDLRSVDSLGESQASANTHKWRIGFKDKRYGKFAICDRNAGVKLVDKI